MWNGYRSKNYSDKESKNGIYIIKNKINGRIYIGRSTDIKGRWKEHKNALKQNKHSNKELQNDWNVYGKDNFIFKIIEECSYEDRTYRELYYFFQYDNVYNIISRKETIIYNLIESLKKINQYKDIKFYYQHKTEFNDKKIKWDLFITYQNKEVYVHIHNNIFNNDTPSYKNKLNFIEHNKNAIMISKYVDNNIQFDLLNNELFNKILSVLSLSYNNK